MRDVYDYDDEGEKNCCAGHKIGGCDGSMSS